LTKNVTKRIVDFAFTHGIIRSEQFGFRNNEEYISLFVSIREIRQRKKFNDQFIFLVFLDLKKAYDSVPIYNIHAKHNNIDICGKCFQFITNIYLTLKAHRGCSLSPILFNIFINDIFDKYKRYGMITERKKRCSVLVADDIVLLAPTKSSLKTF